MMCAEQSENWHDFRMTLAIAMNETTNEHQNGQGWLIPPTICLAFSLLGMTVHLCPSIHINKKKNK
jgi:hypothetical protein